MTELIDSYNREFYYLRLSLIDLCNFQCSYCLPEGNTSKKKSNLNLQEIERLLRVFAQLGVSKVRLTGGEPSLRKDFIEVVSLVCSIPGINKVVCSSNAYKLANQAKDLVRAGLHGINVSVDSLDAKMFHRITGHDKLQVVLDGIKQAQQVGFSSIKVNAVLLKSFNTTELDAYLHWVKHESIDVRFIELMETANNIVYFGQNHVRGEYIKDKLLNEGWRLKPRGKDDGPAQMFFHDNYKGKIGLIMPYSKDFCDGCNRLRVSSVGDLHLCLFGNSKTPLRDYLQYDYQAAELAQLIRQQLKFKKSSHFLQQGDFGMTPHLASIGG